MNTVTLQISVECLQVAMRLRGIEHMCQSIVNNERIVSIDCPFSSPVFLHMHEDIESIDVMVAYSEVKHMNDPHQSS